MKRNLIIETSVILFVTLFAISIFSQLVDYAAFKAALYRSSLIGGKAAIVALALPIAEGLVSLLLLFTRTRLWGFYGSFALMTAFTLAYPAYAGYTGTAFYCGGVLKQMNGIEQLIFTSSLWLLSLSAIWPPSIKPPLRSRPKANHHSHELIIHY